MMHRTIIAFALFTCLAWMGCTSDSPSSPPISPPTATPEKKPAENLPAGHHTKVFTIGFPWRGEPSTAWELYEEYVTDDAGHELYRKSYYSMQEECITTQFDTAGHELLQVRTTTQVGDKSEFKSIWNADFSEKTTSEYSPKEGRTVFTSKSKYDPNGRLVLESTEDTHVPDVVQKTQIRNVYDGQGRLIEVHELINGKEILGTRHTFDATGHRLKTERFDAAGAPSQIETYKYDAQGHMLERHLQDFSAYHTAPQLAARFEYDAAGRCVRETRFFSGNCDPAGIPAGRCVTASTITYSYDAEGRLATEVHEKAGRPPVTMRKRYEYLEESGSPQKP